MSDPRAFALLPLAFLLAYACHCWGPDLYVELRRKASQRRFDRTITRRTR